MEQIDYGTQVIRFHHRKVERKTLGIEVHPDLSVWAIAPRKSTLKEVKQVVEKRASWIVKQQRYFEQFLPRTPERQYVSGETHFYLGRRYILRVRKSSSEGVKLIGGELIVYYQKDNSPEAVMKLLTPWYYNHAKRKFDEVVSQAVKKFSTFNIADPSTEIRRMKNRWGSCTSTNKIILNPELIKAPGKCIEYVAVHELCHLIHRDHNKKFFQLQESIFPEWERWKDRLENILV